jgi:cyclopropane fatty-acyl-phospholipid synthase-like methyltransferase
VLQPVLAQARRLLEIGSGTGQHAVHCAAGLPHLQWQTSDLQVNHAGIQAWLDEAGPANVLAPITLDMTAPCWPQASFDAVFSANTCHIMAWPEVQCMVQGAAALLPVGGLLCIYGPFNENGQATSLGNADFDAALRAATPHRGLRDLEAMVALAQEQGLMLEADYTMPANNRLLVWRRSAPPEPQGRSV